MGSLGLWRWRLLWTAAALLALAAAAAGAAADQEGGMLKLLRNEDDAWLDCDQHKPCKHHSQCVYDSDSVATCSGLFARQEGAYVCGCCPGCVPAVAVGEKCSDDDVCVDGAYCELDSDNVKRCTEGPCTVEKKKPHASWTPTCDADGKFAPVQCKGSAASGGRCFCWSPDGARLDGQLTWTWTMDMHCACSVRAWELEQEGRLDEAPRCKEDGSFEELQCARGLCWCAHQLTGAPQGRVVPETAVSVLFCYNAAALGSRYRRRCDSQLEANALITRLLAAHGAKVTGLPDVACDLDGGYGPVQLGDGQYFCSQKDKSPISGYLQSTAENTNIDCNCARDKVLLSVEEDCTYNGNYRTFQSKNKEDFCVDADGFYMYSPGTGGTC